jgi:hypothetical protein
MRLGIIARSDNTGLGNQTRELVKLLEPSKIMLIDSTPFNNNEQHPEWYVGYDVMTTNGFATDAEVDLFLDSVDVVLSCEIFYSDTLITKAKEKKVKTILQYNFELFENVTQRHLPLPDVLLAPSLWNIGMVNRLFGRQCKVVHLPPPTDFSLFEEAREENLSKDHLRILHIAGKIAAQDRNGTETILKMLKHSTADYELVIKTQSDFEGMSNDPRLTIDKSNVKNNQDLYVGFDAMVLPRRYAGLCLPMNEALVSGLPVFMTNIEPNNFILPESWLTQSRVHLSFRTKAGMISVYEADPKLLAQHIDNYVNSKDKQQQKLKAIDIGRKHFVDELKTKYLEIINE